jgi:predicted acyltransferase
MAGDKKAAASIAKERLVSVDALRGFDMFWIIGGRESVIALLTLIFHPAPEAVLRQLDHAEWIGFRAWDIIMPLFLFIVGTALPFSMSKHIGGGGGDRRAVYIRIVKRFFVLFLIGMIIQGNLFSFRISQLHIYCNTLQAIACGYLVAAIVIMNAGIAWQGIAFALLLSGYALLLAFVPIPGHAAGILEQHANLAMYIDEVILGRFRDGTTYTWILSGMGFAATILLGVMSGHILRLKIPQWNKAAALAAAGCACLAAGLAAGLWQPIIKHIWTSSFVLYSGGWCFLLLALFYVVIDIFGFKKWAFFFIVIGSNALFAYSFPGIIGSLMPHGTVGNLQATPLLQQGEMAFGILAGMWILLYIMFRKRIFIKV